MTVRKYGAKLRSDKRRTRAGMWSSAPDVQGSSRQQSKTAELMAMMLCYGLAQNQVDSRMPGWLSGGQTLVEKRGMPSVYF